jgi:hypothetical protein
MAAVLSSASFAKLYCAAQKSSPGTVTGTGFGQGDPVNIENGDKKKKWSGSVGTNVSGNTWNATVYKDAADRPSPDEDTETVTVTVTSNNDPSNGVQTQSDVIPP